MFRKLDKQGLLRLLHRGLGNKKMKLEQNTLVVSFISCAEPFQHASSA